MQLAAAVPLAASFAAAARRKAADAPLLRAGMHTVRYFRAKKFNWLGLSQQPSLTAKVRRVAGQFLPWSYEDFDWQLTSGMRCSWRAGASFALRSLG